MQENFQKIFIFTTKFKFLFRYTDSVVDHAIDCRQCVGLRRHLHRPGAAEDRQPVPGVAGHRRRVRRRPGDDVCRRQRPARLLAVRRAVLRHLGRLRRHVLHGVHPQPLRNLPRQIHPH